MLGARPVTALAADALGQLCRERLRAPIRQGLTAGTRIGVVAEHALVPDAPGHAFVVGAVVAGGHPPFAGGRVPRERQLVKISGRNPIDVAACVIARADNPVDDLLEDVNRSAVGRKLIAPEQDVGAAASHLEVLLRRRVKERRRVEILDSAGPARPNERPGHSHVLIGPRAIRVTVAADGVVHVAAHDHRGDQQREHASVYGVAGQSPLTR